MEFTPGYLEFNSTDRIAMVKAIAALILPGLLMIIVVGALSETIIFQTRDEFICPAREFCSDQQVLDGSGRLIYEEDVGPAYCECEWFFYINNPGADTIGMQWQFQGFNVCVSTSVYSPTNVAFVPSVVPCAYGDEEIEKVCAGSNICTQWCAENCTISGQMLDSYFPYGSSVAISFINYNDTTATVPISITVNALALLPPAPPVLPQLNPEYFNPFTYDPGIDSPLRGVKIDFTFLARSIVTVINIINAGGYLTWIAAFAVIFIILTALINYILKRISGGGG